MATGGHLKKKNIYKKVELVILIMFKPTAGRIQLDINSLLVNIYTDRYVGNEGIYIVFSPFRANAHNSTYSNANTLGFSNTHMYIQIYQYICHL